MSWTVKDLREYRESYHFIHGDCLALKYSRKSNKVNP